MRISLLDAQRFIDSLELCYYSIEFVRNSVETSNIDSHFEQLIKHIAHMRHA
ncbi:hypothetical protein KSF78_0008963 [Schistosoma japonicum]|nr:hypothetical protein KSF78_0008963 [Schistosoma japonicum]